MQTAKEISSGHKNPKSADTKRRTDLVLIESKTLFGMTEEDLNGPTLQIAVEYVQCREVLICTDKSTQSFWHTESILGIGNQNHSIFQIIQVPLIAIDIILPLANGNKADMGIRFMDIGGKL